MLPAWSRALRRPPQRPPLHRLPSALSVLGRRFAATRRCPSRAGCTLVPAGLCAPRPCWNRLPSLCSAGRVLAVPPAPAQRSRSPEASLGGGLLLPAVQAAPCRRSRKQRTVAAWPTAQGSAQHVLGVGVGLSTCPLNELRCCFPHLSSPAHREPPRGELGRPLSGSPRPPLAGHARLAGDRPARARGLRVDCCLLLVRKGNTKGSVGHRTEERRTRGTGAAG